MGWLATLIRWEKIKKTITELFAHFTFKFPPPVSNGVEYLKEMKSGKWKELVRREESEEKKEKEGEFLMSYIVLSLREHTLLNVDGCDHK
jgi:hypothetical protein